MKFARWLLTTVSIASIACGGAASSTGAGRVAEARHHKQPEPEFHQGGSSAPIHERGDESVVARMGPAGGSLELADGPRLEMPHGTFDGPQDVVFRLAKRTTAFLNYENQKPVGPTLVISPEMQPPEGSWVTLSVPFSSVPEGYSETDLQIATEEPEERQRAFADQSVVTRWHYAAAKVEQGLMVARFDYLAGMRVQFVFARDEY